MTSSKRVTFQIDATDNATAKFKQVQASVGKLNDSAKEASSGISKYGAVFSSVGSAIMSAAKVTAAGITAIGVTAALIAKSTVSAFIQMENAMTGLSSVAKAFNQDVDKSKEAARNLSRDGLMPLSDAAAGLKNLLASGFNLPEAIKLMNAFKDSAAFNRQGALSFGEAIRGATEGIKNGNSILVDNAGVTKNLSLILQEAGFSAQDLMKASTDASVRQALFNGIIKETTAFTGDAAKAAETMGGKVSQAGTSFFEFKALVGEGLAPVVGGLVTRFKEMIDSLTFVDEQGIKRLTPSVQKLVEQLGALAGKVINDLITSLGGWIERMGGADGIYAKMQNFFTIMNNDVIPIVVAFGKVMATVIKAVMFVIGALRDYFEEKFYNMFVVIYAFENLWLKFKGSFSSAMQGIKAIFFSVWDSIKQGLVDGINFFVNKINDLIGKLNKVPGVDIKKLGTISAKAEGGPVSGNTPYLVGERGPELFVPRNGGTIIPNNKLGGGGAVFNFTFNGDVNDPEKLINMVKTAVNRELELSQYGIG